MKKNLNKKVVPTLQVYPSHQKFRSSPDCEIARNTRRMHAICRYICALCIVWEEKRVPTLHREYTSRVRKSESTASATLMYSLPEPTTVAGGDYHANCVGSQRYCTLIPTVPIPKRN